MPRRLAHLSLLCAWLCASGAMLDVAQVAAWARMFTGYARTESIGAAARDTFDPARPCELCRAVGRCRDSCERHGTPPAAAGVEKIVLMLEGAAAPGAVPARAAWPRESGARAPECSAEVPVPPPRVHAPIGVS